MNNAMLVGPFVLPYSLLLSFAAVASTLYVGKRSGRSAGIDVEPVLWHTLLVGLVVARLAFDALRCASNQSAVFNPLPPRNVAS